MVGSRLEAQAQRVPVRTVRVPRGHPTGEELFFHSQVGALSHMRLGDTQGKVQSQC